MARKKESREERRNRQAAEQANQQQYYNNYNQQTGQTNGQQYYNQQGQQYYDYSQQTGQANGQQYYDYSQQTGQANGQQYYNYNQQTDQQQYYNQQQGQQYYNQQYYNQQGQQYYNQQQGQYYYQQGPDQTEVSGKKKKKRKKRKIILFILEVIILVALAAALYVAVQLSKITATSEIDTDEKDEIKSQISAQLSDDVEETLSGYWNIALYGVDSRNSDTQGLSDTIIICSINRETKDVKLVSVYRDTYLDNTNGEYRKATECYLMGGPSRSINMLNKNFDLDIVNYITVNMNIVAEVVDAVGGVEIEITEDEATWINNYQNETSEIIGQTKEEVYGAGTHLLNGLQATSYCRIRAVGNADYERTERQRKVIAKVLEKVQSNPTLLISIINDVYDYVSTNLTKTEILDLAADVASYNLADTTGFPFEKQSVQMDNDIVVAVDLAQNVTELHQYLFGNDGYTPSSTVQEISDEIANATGVY